MPFRPEDWNVVVVGHWNRAILTPAWISQTLFGLAPGTPVEVLVPLDVVGPYVVQHAGLSVVPGADRIIVQPARPDPENLARAVGVARRLLEDLPRTPVSAAGFNVRYRSGGPAPGGPAPGGGTLGRMLANEGWDDRLADARYRIESRAVTRAVGWNGGRITVNLTEGDDGRQELFLNFELAADAAARLREWLDVTAEAIRAEVDRIRFRTLSLGPEDFADV